MKVETKIVKRFVHKDYEAKLNSYGLDDLLPSIYAARGVSSIDDVSYTLKNLVPFKDLFGINKAADLIIQAINSEESIVVVGDYDADGATAVAVVISAFRMFGVKKINFIVPDRVKDGYGLSKDLVDSAVEKYQPKLLITVDSGIKDIEGVEHANSLGVKVLITDHHIPGEDLPNAAAILNPNLKENINFGSKCMAGVGVAFYLMLAVRAKLRELDWFVMRDIADPNMAELLDLVALGTIADVVELDRNNRLMVFQGLLRIKTNKTRVGIRALFAVSQRNMEDASSSDLGFALAPHINAAGRLDDISIGVKLLITKDPIEADILAAQLHDLNIERKNIEINMHEQALEIINDLGFGFDEFRSGLCLYKEEWHQGIIGILASRLKDAYNVPVVILTKHSEQELKGSARSIEGIDVRSMIADIADKYPSVVLKYGGHKTAAGLTISADGFDVFQQAFRDLSAKLISEDGKIGVEIESDGDLPASRLTVETARMLRSAGPWGQGFVEPVFSGIFNIVEQRVVGSRHLKLGLQVVDGYEIVNGIVFNVDLDVWPNEDCKQIKVLYRLDVNEFRGFNNLQLVIHYIEAYS